MENFVRIVMEKQEGATKLDESIFAESQTFVTEQDCTVKQIPLLRELAEDYRRNIR